MAAIHNPFQRPSPFRVGTFQRFQHVPSYTGASSPYSALPYSSQTERQTYRIFENNWVFNQNNLEKRPDFSRGYQRATEAASFFDSRLKFAQFENNKNEQHKDKLYKQGVVENPFHRKNLLVDINQVKKQMQTTINTYQASNRNYNETNSQRRSSYRDSHRPEPYRSSFDNQSNYRSKTNSYNDTPYRQQNFSPSQTLSLPRQPQVAVSPSPQSVEDVPLTISIKGKKFFLSRMQ